MKMSYKAIKLAELRNRGHLRVIVLSDFSLVAPVPAKFSIFVRSSLTTENIKIRTCRRAFVKAFNQAPTPPQHLKTDFQMQLYNYFINVPLLSSQF